MTLETALEGWGFTADQAHLLAQHTWFHHKRKTDERIEQMLDEITEVYNCSKEKTIDMITKFPQFAGLDHCRVVREATQVYGNSQQVINVILKFPQFAGYDPVRVVREATCVYGDEQKVKQAILRHPQFAGLDHVRVVQEATMVYGDKQKVKQAILKFPPFVSLDHVRVVQEATMVYGDEQKVKQAILKYPPFAGYNHERVVREATQVYGDEQKVKQAILKFPSFAGFDHERVMRERSRIGRIAGLDRQRVIDHIINNPVLVGYSAKRYLAGLDVARTLAAEGFEWNEIMLKAFLCYYTKSPYVPGTDRQRISHVPNAEQEPPLLKKMRSYLKNHQ